jgi:hypothetical protein
VPSWFSPGAAELSALTCTRSPHSTDLRAAGPRTA